MITRYQVCSKLQPHLRTDAGSQSTTHTMRFIEVPRVDYEKLSDDRLGEPSANMQARVEAARQIQRERFDVGATHESPIHCNADMRPAMNQLQLSARAYYRVLKLARTLADLAGEKRIGPTHLAEALQYRPKLGML